MITIKELKKQYIDNVLSKTGLSFNIFTDLGDYKEAIRNGNNVTEYINGLFTITQSEIQRLSGYAEATDGAGDMFAYAYVATLEFLIPVGDWANENGAFPSVEELRGKLSAVLQKATKISVSDGDNTYIGGVLYSLPVSGQRAIRDVIGDSIAYRCEISFAFLANGLNASDILLKVDDAFVSFTTIKFNRTPALSSDILHNTVANGTGNGESTVYSESTQFKIEFSVPALTGMKYSDAIFNYILGLENGNAPHTVGIYKKTGENNNLLREMQMIFGGCEMQGSGVSNILYSVSLVPYTTPEMVGG